MRMFVFIAIKFNVDFLLIDSHQLLDADIRNTLHPISSTMVFKTSVITSMSNPKQSPYIRFLNLIDALDRMNPGKKLDCTEESLLDKIVSSTFEKQPVLVGDLISLSNLGSQATLHGRLKNLSAMGYIKMVANEDGRKKEVLPTKLAMKRYEEISKCLEKAAKSA